MHHPIANFIISYSVYVPKIMKNDWEYAKLLQSKPCAVFLPTLYRRRAPDAPHHRRSL